jgi:beta-lactamase superfamily II metal-dependent hydrolase
MATKKASKKTTKKSAPKKAARKPAKKAAKKVATKTRAGGKGQLRVRMYRVGFGDFFLITVPTKAGPKHILIDCGVHAGDIGSMEACVQDLAKETNRKLALVVVTHYHADHLSGFASQFEEFTKFEVDMVWITNRLDPSRKDSRKFKAQIAEVANKLQLRLGARENQDEATALAMAKLQNATGRAFGVKGKKKKEGSNEKALRLVTKEFGGKPPVKYYQGGQKPLLPKSLQGSITAELLGPAPLTSGKEFASSDNKSAQYIMHAADNGLPPTDTLMPFEKKWPAVAGDYNEWTFKEYRTEADIKARVPGTETWLRMEKVLQDAQPDTLLAIADAVDGTLNNQSLVILFTCKGKKLLFVGDAQWGNWAYWLYGKKSSGQDLPTIKERANEILGSIDFYKVGHHGSSNANPIPAMAALNPTCVSMCSTESSDAYPGKKRPYGTISKDPNKKGTEVPRITLMEEMEKRTHNRLVRSDWIELDDPKAELEVKASPEAKGQLKKLPPNFSKGDLYVDYVFPK